MYDSGISVKNVVSMLEGEVDIASAINPETCARWISSLEQLLYADIIKFYRSYDISLENDGFELSSLTASNETIAPTFDDIVKVYCQEEELVKCGAIAAYQFKDDKAIYWQEGNTVKVRLFGNSSEVHVITKVRPKIKNEQDDETVKVPYEWLEMILSKVRGEAYKLAGDDAQAAKWLNDYNVQLESFKAWINERQKWFGE